MGMVGSFIGFTIGGAAATMEVERNMPDAQRYIGLTSYPDSELLYRSESCLSAIQREADR